MIKSSSRSVCQFHNSGPRVVLKFRGVCPRTGVIGLRMGCQYRPPVIRTTVHLVTRGRRHFPGGVHTKGSKGRGIHFRCFRSYCGRGTFLTRSVQRAIRGKIPLSRVTMLFQAGVRPHTLVRCVISTGLTFRAGSQVPSVCRR